MHNLPKFHLFIVYGSHIPIISVKLESVLHITKKSYYQITK